MSNYLVTGCGRIYWEPCQPQMLIEQGHARPELDNGRRVYDVA